MSTASSSFISIVTPSNSASSSLTVSLQSPIISIPKTHFKTPNLSLNFKPHFFNFSPHLRSSIFSLNSSAYDEVIQASEPPATEEKQEELEEESESESPNSCPSDEVIQASESPAIEEEQEELEDDDEEEESELESESESPEAGRLYVGNLPYAITSSELSQVFGESGNVVSVEIVYDRVTDRSRGFAFITMASVQEAKDAIRMFDGSQIGGRTVRVNFPEVPRGGEREVMGPKIRTSNKEFIESPHKIYAGNLSWIITSERLKDAFADQPGLLSAKVIYEKNSGRSRGFGFVTFSSPEAAESALNAMNGVEVEGRPLRLNLAEGNTDTTRPPRPGRSSQINVDGSEILSSISS